jgi:hypothetical protein
VGIPLFTQMKTHLSYQLQESLFLFPISLNKIKFVQILEESGQSGITNLIARFTNIQRKSWKASMNIRDMRSLLIPSGK